MGMDGIHLQQALARILEQHYIATTAVTNVTLTLILWELLGIIVGQTIPLTAINMPMDKDMYMKQLTIIITLVAVLTPPIWSL